MKIDIRIVFAAAAMLTGACSLEDLELGSVDQLSASDPTDPPQDPTQNPTQEPTQPPSQSMPPSVPKAPLLVALCEITWDTNTGQYVDTGTCIGASQAAAPKTCTANVIQGMQCNIGIVDTPHNDCSNDVPKRVGSNLCFMGNLQVPPLPRPEIPGGPFPRPDAEEDDTAPSDPGV